MRKLVEVPGSGLHEPVVPDAAAESRAIVAVIMSSRAEHQAPWVGTCLTAVLRSATVKGFGSTGTLVAATKSA